MKLRAARSHVIINRSRIRLLAAAGAAALALTGVAAAGPGGPAARAAVSFAQPAITVADGNTVIAVQTAEDGLRFYWNEHGTNTWHGEQVAANGTTFSAPAMIADGNSVVIAAAGLFNSLDFYWQVNGASGWNPETVAGNRTTYSAPAMALDGNTVVIAAEGASNSLKFYWAVNGTATWGPETVAGPGTTFSAPAEAVNGNGVNIAAEGPGNSLDFYWAFNGTSTWTPDVVAGAGSTDSTTAPALAADGSWASIIALNPIGIGSVVYQNQNGVPGWIQRTMTGFNTGTGTSNSPMVTAGDQGYVAQTGAEGDVQVFQIEADPATFNWPWSDGPVTPDTTAASAPALTFNGGLANIAYIGGTGNLYLDWGALHDGDLTQELVDTAANL
jgi:hypothetical protein